MKIRLSQSKCGSTGALNLRHELLLHAFHFRSPAGRFVIKASEMEKAVRYVETQLMRERGPESPRLAPGCFHADYDFAVLESDHVGRARFIEEALVELGHTPVGNQSYVHFVELRQHLPFPCWKFEARG
jgi:hypothetical protein